MKDVSEYAHYGLWACDREKIIWKACEGIHDPEGIPKLVEALENIEGAEISGEGAREIARAALEECGLINTKVK